MTQVLERDAALTPIRLLPINSAADSKGSIHDDEKAREMGYRGGLVSGSTILAYMRRLMYASFGADWLADSALSGRLRRPVYEGGEVTIEGTVVEAPTEANGRRVTVELRVLTPEGEVAAIGQASCRVTPTGSERNDA